MIYRDREFPIAFMKAVDEIVPFENGISAEGLFSLPVLKDEDVFKKLKGVCGFFREQRKIALHMPEEMPKDFSPKMAVQMLAWMLLTTKSGDLGICIEHLGKCYKCGLVFLAATFCFLKCLEDDGGNFEVIFLLVRSILGPILKQGKSIQQILRGVELIGIAFPVMPINFN